MSSCTAIIAATRTVDDPNVATDPHEVMWCQNRRDKGGVRLRWACRAADFGHLVAWRRCRSTEWSLESVIQGSGAPMLFIPPRLTADADSTAADGQGSISRDAAHSAALLDVLGLDRVHIVGLSFSGAIALQLALSALARVHGLTLIEPSPPQVPLAAEFRAANAQLVAVRQPRELQSPWISA
jgi:pimeloyl-ACP methyl ester carboxylesterase